jgi:hypothetical protein
MNKFKVTFWDGKTEVATDRKAAVKIVKRGLKTWMQNGDRIVWTYQYPDVLFLGAAFVVDNLDDATDASAVIEEVET